MNWYKKLIIFLKMRIFDSINLLFILFLKVQFQSPKNCCKGYSLDGLEYYESKKYYRTTIDSHITTIINSVFLY